MDGAPAVTAGVIINPKSGKGNRKGLELAELLKGVPGVDVRLLQTFPEIGGHVGDFARSGVTDIFISSGDGTIQEIQTLIAEKKQFARLPRLCLLPHGTTNMTAADLGYRNRDLKAQAAFIGNPQPRDTVQRPTLRVANPRDNKPRHGMFLGAGAAAYASKYCQDAVHRSGLKGEWATFATLASSVLQSLTRKADPDDLDRIDRPHDLRVMGDGLNRASGKHLMVLVTTLEKLILGTKPFWGGKTGPLRVSVFPYPVPNVVRWLIPAMYGSEGRKPPPGSVSFTCQTCDIETPSLFIIDGEFFEAPQGEPLHIETGPDFTYIRD